MTELCYFSCLNYNNESRNMEMKNKFNMLNIECKMYQGVDYNDNRIKDKNFCKKAASCMYGHLDMIYDFYYNSDKNFGIFCEDDILINKNLSNYLPNIINDVETMNLDILLLGYLIAFKIEHFYTNFSTIKKSNLENDSYYHKYPEDLWGTQMYLITRNYAKILLDNYYYDYSDKTLNDNSIKQFSADWIITKNGNRALIYPMLAVEDGKYYNENTSQDNYHKKCFLHNFTEEFI